MTINFKITNTTSSEVVLKVDGIVISSQFVYSNSQAEFSLEDSQINDATSITIENSDVIYDITDSCKYKVSNYVKPIYKVEPESGIHTTDDQADDLPDYYDLESYDYEKPSVKGFADDIINFEEVLKSL